MKTCTKEGCDQPVKAVGLCNKHYYSNRMKQLAENGPKCRIEGCDKPHFAALLCRGHYARKLRKKPLEGVLSPIEKPDAFVRCRIPKTAIAKLHSEAARLSVSPEQLLSIFVLRSLGLQP